MAEAVRLDGDASAEVKPDVERQACAASTGTEQRILHRARLLAERNGMLETLRRWLATLRWTLGGFAFLAVLLGFSAALTVLGDGGASVNIIWALGALLGLNLVMLLLWLVNMLLAGPEAGGGLGRAWLSVSQRLAGSRNLTVARAFATLTSRARLNRWFFSVVTHGFWLLFLSAAMLSLLLALSLRSYSFVWETTILSSNVFVSFVEWSAWLPSLLGFAVPDAEMVRSSAHSVPGADTAVQGEALRRAWSSWLLGALLVYGLLPRLALLLLSLAVLRARTVNTRLDLSAPAWAILAARLSPGSERGGITDPDKLPGQLIPMHRAEDSDGEPVLLAVELGSDTAWPPAELPATVHVPAPAESRELRRQAEEVVQRLRPARLLLACDARLSPDRGTLRWLVELSAWTAASRVWLLQAGEASGSRLTSWRESLLLQGFEEREILTEPASAIAWVSNGDGSD